MNYKLQDTNVIMVYVGTRTKKQLKNFREHFQNKYSDECNTMVISGDYTNNKNVIEWKK